MAELKTVLLKGMQEHFHKECSEITERIDQIKSLLRRITQSGSLVVPMTIMGMEVHNHEFERDLNLLEKCGLIASKVKFTERNSYRVYFISEEGSTLLEDLS